ncbi:MAG: T9SS type A sorting domain-containing protein [Bacteroidetes bacterium]|nr:T9SS type A sorting domain-containing protein [Bacteroidota bacterium]
MIRLSVFVMCFFGLKLAAQDSVSIHQQQLEYYNSLGHTTAWYEENVNTEIHNVIQPKVGCTPTKIVYGWHPYWVGSAYNNYDWSLLTHFSFFSYEVNPSTGGPLTTHGWATSTAVDAALANGVKVTLCVTLFGSSDLTTFLTNSTAKQNLIDNLINLVQTRGAHGVNIDFEGLPSSQTTNFANFMVDLSNQMHTAIPGSEVSTVLYAVDWSNVFNFSIMEPEVDNYIVMGYAYYYQGSSTTGPNDPLYHFGSTYNVTLSKTITDYVDAGCPKSKLVMGLPYYGYEWPTSSLTIPSSTTGTGVARTYEYVMTNTSGNYSTGNHTWDTDSYTDIFTFNSSGNKQCYIPLEDAFRKRLQHVNTAGIAGIGIWALGYDDGYTEMWTAISDFMTECYSDSCSGMIHDFGGPTRDYYNNEDYTWTIAPPAATSIDVSFSSFDVELNYDYLYIYDGPSTASPLIGTYTGTNSPGNFSTSSGVVTFRFTSDISTVSSGFNATYACVTDATPPVTAVSTTGTWQTTDFTADFTDTDNISIAEKFYTVADFEGTEWRSNTDFGFFTDEFSGTVIHPDWTSQTGTWILNSGALQHTDETVANSNIHAALLQDDQHAYLYHWQGQINGAGTNRRAGLHFFCSDATLDQRGDSYMVYWRADQNKCQIYKSVANSIVLMTDDDVIVDPNVTYDFKIYVDPATGTIKAFLDNVLVSEWTDPSPLSGGTTISPRTGNALGIYDNLTVYKSRTATETITIGSAADEVRYQNPDPLTPAARISSINLDAAANFSVVDQHLVNIDWTAPVAIPFVNDGNAGDDDFFTTASQISANWAATTDPHSAVVAYWYAVGTTAGVSDVVAWTDNGLITAFTETGLSLSLGQVYFVSVKAIDGAGLETVVLSSDGQTLQSGTIPPTAGFSAPASVVVCNGEAVQFTNTSTNASSYFWEFENGTPATSTAINPVVSYTSSGSFEVTLHAIEGTDTNTTTQFITINVAQAPLADFSSNSPAIWPNAAIFFTNNSTNASSYFWDFGDGNTSVDSNPWNDYGTSGTYSVMLVAENDLCPNDTIYQLVDVIDVAALSEEKNAVQIYPNPFIDQIFIKGVIPDAPCTILVYDQSGRLVISKQIVPVSSNLVLDLSQSLSRGIYTLTLIQGDSQIQSKLVKN